MTTTSTAQPPRAWWNPSHRHSRRCWWNWEIARWVCAPADAAKEQA